MHAGPPYPHFDIEGHWEFILIGLSRFQAEYGIAAITVTTHGAAGALLDGSGTLAAPVLDYEYTGPDTLAADYNTLRPPFSETGSPRLSMGLNLGAQLHFQFATDPSLKDRVAAIVTYPQFWGYRLTGVLATDVTSLGCHTDLWNPYKGQFSSLPETLGLADKTAPARKPGDLLGPITAEIALRTGLPAATPVYCGIHDSNASLLPHLTAQEPPFSVVSTGTWVIAMAVGGKPVTLDPALDTLVNVNAFGDPVPSARFMGGREHDLALGESIVAASDADIAHILHARVMLLPALASDSGPFAGAQSRWIGGEPPLGTGRRTAAMGLYLALVTARCLALVGHQGPIIIEGPFAQNRTFLSMLGVATSSPIVPMGSATGTSQGAAQLIKGQSGPKSGYDAWPPPSDERRTLMQDYAAVWASETSRHVGR
ncbi:FGGY-family carbohydrate kinase [Yoonia sp.]|uniref:FGGY-family carbohydrate kinase n=1 Tax=Yoonia sp. TaxID=2212373 RepID=UPI002FDA9D65